MVVDPSSIQSGSSVDITATITQAGGASAPPAGDHVNFYATASGSSEQVFLGQGDVAWNANSPATGTATLTVGGWQPGFYTIEADYTGDTFNNPSSGTASLGVTTQSPTTLTYTGPASIATGTSANVSFQLLDASNNPVALEPVTITVNGHDYPGTTDASGTVSTPVTLPVGSYAVGAQFTGDANYLASTGSGTLIVTMAPTTIVYTGDTQTRGGQTATLSATLTDQNGNPVGGELVTFSFGSVHCQSTTNLNGVASCTVTVVDAPGSYTVTASFGGDGTYLGSSGTGTITVANKLPTTIVYTGDTTTGVGQTATLSAKLTAQSGSPLGGKVVTLSFGSVSCQATTNVNGVASCTVTVVDVPGSYTVTASFAGDVTYLASSGTGTITVAGKVSTRLVDNTTGNFLQGSTTTLSATLTTSAGAPLAGKTIYLTLGLSACHGLTNASGVASCTVTVPGPTGPTVSTATFLGDTGANPALDAKPALVYAFAGSGSFVVGDRSATGSVTFWGSQWAKSNSLSGGAADNSFKGFAVSPATPQCGGTWTTDPGNSAPPPRGPLPAYMAVAVTSKTAKSGKTISGNVVHVVIVKTNPGYDANPGHPGTGTVVATVC